MRNTKNRRRLVLLWIVVLGFLGILGIGMLSVGYVLAPSKSRDSIRSDISIIADDGIKLVASENILSKDTHRWVILIHSYRTDSSFMEPYAEKYQEAGFHTILPDNRAHGNSDGKYIGMGYLDQYDILCWINYILARDADAEIYLHGVSMGGAALMMLSGQADLPKNVKAIIEDCGYSSAENYLTWKLKQRFGLPAFPIIPIANIAFKTVAGYSIEEASALEGVKNSSIPILFIHGTEDTTVPVEEVYQLYNAATCEKKLYVVDGAGHGEALWKDQKEYWNQVFMFIRKMRFFEK